MLIDTHHGLEAHITSKEGTIFGDARHGLLKHPFRLVQFVYPVADLREEVYKRTSVLGKYRLNKEGKSLFDLYTLSQDEASTFDMLLRQAADEVALLLQPFMLNSIESYIFNRDYINDNGLCVSVFKGDYVRAVSGDMYVAKTDGDTTQLSDPEIFSPVPAVLPRSVHYIVKRPVNTLSNMDTPVDNAIMEALVLYIIWQWLMLIEEGNGNKAQLYGQLWQEARTNVKLKMNLCHKKTQSGHPF